MTCTRWLAVLSPIVLCAAATTSTAQTCSWEDLFQDLDAYVPEGPPEVQLFSGVDVADLDGDGDLDAVAAGLGPASATTVFLNNGDADPTIMEVGIGIGAISARFADLNADGVVDLVLVRLTAGAVQVRLGIGDGTFGSPTDLSFGTNIFDATVVDMNGDDVADIVATEYNPFVSGSVGVFQGIGDGTFLPPVVYPIDGYTLATNVTAEDLDLDGSPDIVVPNHSAGTVMILRNEGDGTLASPVSYAVAGDPRGATVADFNEDGVPDLFVTANDQTCSALLGVGDCDGDGAFNILDFVCFQQLFQAGCR